MVPATDHFSACAEVIKMSSTILDTHLKWTAVADVGGLNLIVLQDVHRSTRAKSGFAPKHVILVISIEHRIRAFHEDMDKRNSERCLY